MSSIIRTHLLVALFLATPMLWGQVVSGVVENSEQEGLPNAQVLLRQGESIVAFALTDVAGAFTLEIKNRSHDSLFLEVQYIGFTTLRVPLRSLAIGEPVTITLTAEELNLKEVTVSAKHLPKITKGDTLVYDAASYRDGSEKKIEEVIAKLPGVEVDEAGNITVEGKNLDRILIDGDDLFDKNYKLLSKNVPADYVNRIDILNNYHQDELVGDLDGSKETILNLHLDPDKRKPVFGEIAVELGNSTTRAVQTNVFRLGKSLKAINFSDYGTLGNPSSVGADLLYRSRGLHGKPPATGRMVLQSAATWQRRIVKPSDYLFNKTMGTAQTILFPIGKHAKNRLIFNLAGEDFDLTDDRLLENTTVMGIDSFVQQNNYAYRTRSFWLTNDLEVLLDKKSRLDLRLSINKTGNSAGTRTSNTLLRTNDQEELSTDLDEAPLSGLGSIRYVRRLDKTTALRISGTLNNEWLDQHQRYRGAIYQNISPRINSADLQQVYDQQVRGTNFQVDILRQIGATQWNHQIGYQFDQVRTEAGLGEAATAPSNSQHFFRSKEYYCYTDVQRAFGSLSIVMSSKLSWIAMMSDSDLTEQTTEFSDLVFQPAIELNYSLGRRSRIRGWGSAGQAIPTADQLVATPYLADGSLLKVGLDTNYLIRSQSAGIGYTFNNTLQQHGYGVDFSLNRTPNGIRSEVVTEDFVILERLLPDFSYSTAAVSLRGDKYFIDLKTDLRFNLRYSRMMDQLSFAGAVLPIRTDFLTSTFTISTRLLKKVNFFTKVNYSFFSNEFQASNNQLQQLQWQQRVVWKPNKRLKCQASMNTYLPRLGQEGQSINLLQASIDLDLPDSNLKLGLAIRNIFNKQLVTERTVSTYQQITERYQLRPRTISVAATKSF